MAHAHKGTLGRPAAVSRIRFTAAVSAILAIIAAAISLAIVLGPPFQAGTSTASGAGYETIVDGWLPAAVATTTTRLERVQDGYLPGLLPADRAAEAVDGWMSGALASVSTAPDTSRSDLRDGWEH